ncbi:MAG TPA: alpha-glucan family phosphorylase [Burkholderiales bacterium]|nr:alpha-glucan family phosphorylase [Burkholderiales bacterium]
MAGTPFILDVNPKLPPRLARLQELAGNLHYSWDRQTRLLFSRLDAHLWDEVGHNPKAFLKRVDEKKLLDAAEDPVFIGNFNRVLSAFDVYLNEPLRRDGSEWLRKTDLIAYFCAEFGFHESLPIYSGGLGILAGDHCKSASDMRLPFVGVGLLYRQGYFSQTIDSEGNQQATYADSDFDDLPVAACLRGDGSEMRVGVEFPGRTVQVKVWQVLVGHVTLYLLDTALAENSPDDQRITYRLYGGDRNARIEQEIVLGIGGVRALQALGIVPTAWHINEGHPAFLILERARALVAQGMPFNAALEAVAANTVFTTHTPVPAGHDHFSTETINGYFATLRAQLGLSDEQFMQLGRVDGSPDFNMTALAIRGSRHQNGVSRIHGGVSSRICAPLWPEIEPRENPLSYVTNGVHVPTFLAPEWSEQFDKFLGLDWSQHAGSQGFQDRLKTMPDHLFWSVRQSLKAQMLHLVRHRLARQHFRNHGSEAHLDRLLRFAHPVNPNVLTIGFARRFATYKRATLLARDLDWLRTILGDESRPLLFIFAGKAHPADVPGQDVIRDLNRIARMPEFEGKILLLEGYDLHLARRLVSGVDVWLNNPMYPMEASGTSGMKAGINGVLNLSVLDGWWGEGYDGHNGWAIKPVEQNLDEARRNFEESRTLYELLQDQVVPTYYRRGEMGYSAEWVRMAKQSIASVLPRFSSIRMVNEYLTRFYLPATRQGRRYAESEFEPARRLALWKQRVREVWPKVSLRRLDAPVKRIAFGDKVRFEVAALLGGLAPEDVAIEMLIGKQTGRNAGNHQKAYRFESEGTRTEQGEQRFALELSPDLCGKLEYRIRLYPQNDLLTHPFELGMMRWL